jgi:uncharacterized membrane protein YphA (DoxX/SURF4 family)
MAAGAFIVAAVFISLGFLTRTFATISALLWMIALLIEHAEPFITIVAALVAVAVALLGGGAFSLDARLFGRRRVVFTLSDNNGS